MDFEVIDLSLVSANGGFNVNWRKVGEYVGPVLPYGMGVPLMNKQAANYAMLTGTAGQVAGMVVAGPPGAAAGRAAGTLAGYYGSLLYRDLTGH